MSKEDVPDEIQKLLVEADIDSFPLSSQELLVEVIKSKIITVKSSNLTIFFGQEKKIWYNAAMQL